MTDTKDLNPGRPRGVILLSLLLATFVAGTAEHLAVGLLPPISSDLDVPVATAGALVGAYALGLAVGGPLLTAATIRLDRRFALAGSMALFAVLTVTPAAVPHFGWFVVVRFATGALQGLLMGAAFTTAASVVPRDRTGRAISVVMAGFAMSTVIGLPLGVLAGALFGWRGTLLVIGAGALAVAGLLAAVIPSLPGRRLSMTDGLRHALSPRVLAMLTLTLTLFAAPGAVLTYLMPLLEQVIGVSGPQASAVLVGFGVASVAGSFLGGRLADTDAARGLILAALGIAASFVALYVARANPLLAVVAILAWAIFASSAPPSIQHRTMGLAGRGGPLVASLPASAASAGIALGSTASGISYSAAGPPAVVLTGIVIALGALALALATRGLRPPAEKATGAPPPPPARQLVTHVPRSRLNAVSDDPY